MKKVVLGFSVLMLLSLACATLTGGGNNSATVDNPVDNSVSSTGNPNNLPPDDAGEDNAAVPPVEEDSSGSIGPDSACYNPFYPLEEGIVYTYQATYTNGTGATEYQLETVALTDDTLTVQMRLPEVTSEVKWLCGEEGLFSTEYAQFDFMEVSEILDIETVSYQGITLPAEDEWVLGNTWDMNYHINIEYMVEDVEVLSNIIGAMTYEIVAVEEVTVPAGIYPEAYRVETTGTITFDMDLMGTAVSNSMNIEMTSWYVKWVGMVRQESTDFIGTSITELITIE